MSLTVPEGPESNHPDVWMEPVKGPSQGHTLLQGADPTCPDGHGQGICTLWAGVPAQAARLGGPCPWDSVEASQGSLSKGRKEPCGVSQDRAGGRIHRLVNLPPSRGGL